MFFEESRYCSISGGREMNQLHVCHIGGSGKDFSGIRKILKSLELHWF